MKLRKYSKIIECRIYVDNAEKTESDNKQNMIKNGMHILNRYAKYMGNYANAANYIISKNTGLNADNKMQKK